MIFLVGGIPNLLFQRFQQIIPRIFGDGHLVISRPTAARHDGKFVPTQAHARDIVDDLSERLHDSPKIAENGCGVLALASPGVAVDAFVSEFQPFAVFRRIDLPVPTILVGEAGRRTINMIAASISGSLKSVREAVRAMNGELTSRRNRTPLLLPQRNFSSPVLDQELNYLYASLGSAPDPRSMIAHACERIEQHHPYRKAGGASFFDDRSVRFKMPGRALHGAPHFGGGSHVPRCLVNAHLRLGGAGLTGFHYDCLRGEDGRLIGNFPDCHASVDRRVGNPHLNIYPNDFIRGG